MRLTTGSLVLVFILLILFATQLWYATTSACPANTRSLLDCLGPYGIKILGLNFNQGYSSTQLIILITSLVIAFAIPFIVQRIKKDVDRLNLGVRIFSLMYIFSSVVFSFFISIISY